MKESKVEGEIRNLDKGWDARYLYSAEVGRDSMQRHVVVLGRQEAGPRDIT